MLLQCAGVGIGCSLGAIVRTIFSAGTCFICRTRLIAMCRIRRRSLVFPACLSGRHHTSFEITRFGRSRDGWFALVGGSTQLRITSCRLNMLRLRSHRTDVALASVGLLPRCRTRFDPSVSTVEANMTLGDIRHSGVVGVVNDGGVHVSDIGVVGKVIAFPATALITITSVAKSIVDAAVKAHFWAPVSFVEKERTLAPTPISWRPKETHLGRFHPRARTPVIAVLIVIGPVTGGPQIAIDGAERFLVNRKWWWAKVHGNADAHLSECSIGKNQKYK